MPGRQHSLSPDFHPGVPGCSAPASQVPGIGAAAGRGDTGIPCRSNCTFSGSWVSQNQAETWIMLPPCQLPTPGLEKDPTLEGAAAASESQWQEPNAFINSLPYIGTGLSPMDLLWQEIPPRVQMNYSPSSCWRAVKPMGAASAFSAHYRNKPHSAPGTSHSCTDILDAETLHCTGPRSCWRNRKSQVFYS